MADCRASERSQLILTSRLIIENTYRCISALRDFVTLALLLAGDPSMQPELRQLPAFLAVADQGSANRAGIALFRAQSAVSRSIHKLESELGVTLFERRARGMLMTEYGRALLVRARRVVPKCKPRAPSLARLPTEAACTMHRYSGC